MINKEVIGLAKVGLVSVDELIIAMGSQLESVSIEEIMAILPPVLIRDVTQRALASSRAGFVVGSDITLEKAARYEEQFTRASNAIRNWMAYNPDKVRLNPPC